MNNNETNIAVNWNQYNAVKEALNQTKGIYIHDWDKKPYYIGKLGTTFKVRYSPGYRHWVEGCLEHGARLFIGVVETGGSISDEILENVERILIKQLRPMKNITQKNPYLILNLFHKGIVPEYLR
jgi:hypothetical protein